MLGSARWSGRSHLSSKAAPIRSASAPYTNAARRQTCGMHGEADKRLLDSSTAGKKADWIALLRRDDKVKAALAAGDFEVLTIAELTKVAEDQKIDLTGKTAKPEIVEQFHTADASALDRIRNSILH